MSIKRYYAGQTAILKGDTKDSTVGDATTSQIRIKDPNGTITNNNASLVDDTVFEYTLSPLIEGVYTVYNYAEFTGGAVKIGSTHSFEVLGVFS